MKRVAVVVIACSTAACFGGRLPPLELYRIALPDRALVATPLGQQPLRLPLPAGSVAIMPYEAPGVYGERNIVYRVGDTQYGAYPSREWALPVATMLGLVTEDVMRRAPITAGGAVFDPPTTTVETYVWRGLVRQFEEVDRGQQVFAAVALDARLVRARDDSVLWSGTVRLERPVPSANMQGIVGGLSSLSAAAVAQLADQARAWLLGAASAGQLRD